VLVPSFCRFRWNPIKISKSREDCWSGDWWPIVEAINSTLFSKTWRWSWNFGFITEMNYQDFGVAWIVFHNLDQIVQIDDPLTWRKSWLETLKATCLIYQFWWRKGKTKDFGICIAWVVFRNSDRIVVTIDDTLSWRNLRNEILKWEMHTQVASLIWTRPSLHTDEFFPPSMNTLYTIRKLQYESHKIELCLLCKTLCFCK
jgi:hypothetical protein